MAYMDGNILDEEFIGTQANWDIEDAVIEIGLVILTQDTDILKLGNGINTFADLEELVAINDIADLVDIAAYIDTTLATEYFEKLAYFNSSLTIQRSDYLEDDFLIGDDFSEVQGVMPPLVYGYVQKTYGTSFTLNADSISAYREKGSYIDHYEWELPEGAIFNGIDMTINIPDNPELVGTFLRYKCVAVDILGNRSTEGYFNVLVSDIDGPALDISWGVQDPLISEVSWNDDIHWENESYVMTVVPTEIEGLNLIFSVTCNDSSVTINQRSVPDENIFDVTYGEYHSNTAVIFTITATNGSDLSCSVGNVKTVIDKNPAIYALSWDNEDHRDNHSYVMTIGAVDPRMLNLTYELICDNTTVNIAQRVSPEEHIFDITYPDYSQDTNVEYTATVTNSEGLADTDTDAIIVGNQVDNPVINSVTWDNEDQYENESYVLTVSATDPNSLDITYSVICNDPAVSIIQQVSPNEHIFDIAYGEYVSNTNLTYTITVINTDTEQTIAIENIVVQNVVADPVINSLTWNNTNHNEGESYVMTVDASDPLGLDLTYDMVCDDNTVGIVQRVAPEAHVFDITYGEYIEDTALTYTVTVTNTDNLTDVEIDLMTVLNVAPIINSVNWNDNDQFENHSYAIAIGATDPSGLDLTYGVVCDDPTVGIVQRVAPNEHIFDVTYGEYISDTDLIYTITVTNTELVSTTTHEYIVVQNEAVPPVINSITWDSTYHYENTTYEMTIDATDPFFLSLVYEVICSDGNVSIIQRGSGDEHIFDVTYGEYALDTNVQFTVTVTNTGGAYDEEVVPKTVHDLDLSNARGIFGGGGWGGTGVFTDIDCITISTIGNAADEGNLILGRRYVVATSNGVFGRGVFAGGLRSISSNVMDYINISTVGNALDFGDLSSIRHGLSSMSNGTNDRGIFAGGTDGTNNTDIIEYITVSLTGNVTNFGNLSTVKNHLVAASNGANNRGVFTGGYDGANYFSTIEYITISTEGNVSPFGNLTSARSQFAGTSNGTNERGVFGGGRESGYLSDIDYVTISTIGNALDFGDLSVGRRQFAATSNTTDDRGVFGSGYNTSSIMTNIIDFVTISSIGNATDFGNLTQTKFGVGATSDA